MIITLYENTDDHDPRQICQGTFLPTRAKMNVCPSQQCSRLGTAEDKLPLLDAEYLTVLTLLAILQLSLRVNLNRRSQKRISQHLLLCQ